MEITREFLKEKNACKDGYEWWCKNCEGLDTIEQIKKLAAHRFDWANWLIVRIMEYEQYASYAVFAAEQVIEIYEKKYPNDNRPRKAIEAAKKCINNPTKENKFAAYDAAYAAYAAYASASAAYDAAASAAYDAAASASASAAYAAYDAVCFKKKIIEYGITLLNTRANEGKPLNPKESEGV